MKNNDFQLKQNLIIDNNSSRYTSNQSQTNYSHQTLNNAMLNSDICDIEPTTSLLKSTNTEEDDVSTQFRRGASTFNVNESEPRIFFNLINFKFKFFKLYF